MKSPVVLLLCIFSGIVLKGQDLVPYRFDGTNLLPIQEHYRYLCDSGNDLSPQLAFTAFQDGKGLTWNKGATFNQGFTRYRYWFLLPVAQASPDEERPMLEIASVIYRLQIYRYSDTGFQTLFNGSTSIAYNLRSFKHREFLMPLNIRAGRTDTFLLCADYRERNMRLSMRIDGFAAVFAREASFSKRFGIYLGILLFILVFNIFLSLSLRSDLHFWYVVYIAAAIVYMLFDYNMDSLLFPNTPTTFSDAVGGLPFDELLVAAALKFMQVFIRQEKTRSRLYYPVSFFIYSAILIAAGYLVMGFLAPAALTAVPRGLQQVFSYHTILGALMIPVSCIGGVVKRKLEPTMYLISSCMPVAGGVIYFLHQVGIIVNGAVAKDAILIGITVEIAILSIYLVERYNRLKREKERLLTDLNQKEQEIVKSIVDTLESERKRIAQDLHDDVGATLSALRLHVSNLPADPYDATSMDAYYQKALFLTSKAARDIRNISHDMIPQDFSGTGLFRTLEDTVAELNSLGRGRFRLITHGDDGVLSNVLALNIYRITRELMDNVIKHSKATEAIIQVVISSTELVILTEDNGIGLRPEGVNKGIGLKNVRSRTDFLKGHLQMDSNDEGTTVIITLPLKA